MATSEQTGAYTYPPICTNKLIFGKGFFFHLILSEYATQSHNFANFNVCDITHLSSVVKYFDRAANLPYIT